jgi:hypothetical protein
MLLAYAALSQRTVSNTQATDKALRLQQASADGTKQEYPFSRCAEPSNQGEHAPLPWNM